MKSNLQGLTACVFFSGAMERFVSSPEERGALVGGIAAECERAAQMDWAVELYMYAGQPGAALALINDQLSNALQPVLSSSAKGRLLLCIPVLLVPLERWLRCHPWPRCRLLPASMTQLSNGCLHTSL